MYVQCSFKYKQSTRGATKKYDFTNETCADVFCIRLCVLFYILVSKMVTHYALIIIIK